MKFYLLIFSLIGTDSAFSAEQVLRLKIGFVQKISCEGKLFVSAVGNDNLVRLESLPKELGCAVILKPTGLLGVTNLILETSTGSVERRIEIFGK